MQDALEPILHKLRTRGPGLRVYGLGPSAKAFLSAALCHKTQRSFLILTARLDRAEQLASDLEFFMGLQDRAVPVVLIPPPEVPTAWSASLQRELTGQRLKALSTALAHKQAIGVASLPAALQPVPAPSWLQQNTLRIQQGDTLDREDLLLRLVSLGYQQVQTVEHPGDFAARGGIVDIYGSSQAHPVRMDLMGDSVESLRAFDSISQRSLSSQEDVEILPASEDGSLEDDQAPAASGSLLDYFPAEGLWVLDEPEELKEKATEPLPWTDGFLRQAIELHELPPPDGDTETNLAWESQSPAGAGLGIKATPFSKTVETLHQMRKQIHLFIVCPGHDQQQRLREILAEHELPALRWAGAPLEGLTRQPPSAIQLVVGHLSTGLILKNLGLGFLTEEELFGKTAARPVKRAKIRPFLTSFEDLKVGDYVVHLNYGIGRFQGLERLAIDDAETDFLVIRYAEGGKIYVPLEHLDRVQKYVGSEGSAPKIDRLGTNTWQRTKQRVKKEVHKLATDLVELYAAREVAEGHVFSKDSLPHKEFDATFEYEETPDQSHAINEVKADMESHRPMDRVVCGDVGYGKTEVAMRAAFKTVMDNRQVAMLVPTTLLAQQHFENFGQRFSAFPVRVEMLSRFRSPKEQKTIARDLAQGKVDIIIGTHRLLQKDISFRDLGLVIVDEEQRFGVAHKEHLKKLRKTVDVLTLTATPIPRTLQMSLTGVRDFSIIDTPPPDRMAVKTLVARFDKGLIREAVRREFEREGQVFFVHNRVKNIERMAHFLKELVPEAKIAVAHGQMQEKDLERVMLRFIRKEYNLLLCTAIIESGLDIPSANTIIINRADQFGLAELYQLRGRVGRSSSQAHAYLLIPADVVLTEEAKKRLMALQEFSELGSGFKIAARDLEIRGAGNLLGKEQSGQIAAVGFELYMQMIEEAVRELKGQPVEEEIDPSLSLRVSAYLPEEYIPDSYQRLSLYKRMASVKDAQQLEELREELQDRFGPLPEPVEHVVQIIQVRLLAKPLKITKIESRAGHLVTVFHPKTKLSQEALDHLLTKYGQAMRFISSYSLELSLPDDRWETRYGSLHSFLEDLLEKQAA